MKSKRSMPLLFIILALTWTNADGKQQPQSAQQLEFSAEEATVQKPVAIPDQVLSLLREDKTVGGVLENENMQPKDLPSSWFSASAIRLSKSRGADLVAIGQPPVSGGSGALFWVFLGSGDGYRLVLAAAAHDLVVKNRYSNGYRDIELISMTATVRSSTLCRFDGKRYIKYQLRSKPIR